MKISSTIARYLLGVIFLVFGLNGFLQFMPMPCLPASQASSSWPSVPPTTSLLCS